MIRIYASDPAYQEINRVALAIAYLANPQLFWDVCQMPDAERLAALEEARSMFEELAR